MGELSLFDESPRGEAMREVAECEDEMELCELRLSLSESWLSLIGLGSPQRSAGAG